MIQSFIVNVEPMGAPRQTRSDTWKKRPCVVRYHEYRDTVRASTRGIMSQPMFMAVTAYIAMPASWSKKKRNAMRGTAHQVKPDADNIFKATSDGIIENDQCIAFQLCLKFWADEPRVEITVSDELPKHLVGLAAGRPAA